MWCLLYFCLVHANSPYMVTPRKSFCQRFFVNALTHTHIAAMQWHIETSDSIVWDIRSENVKTNLTFLSQKSCSIVTKLCKLIYSLVKYIQDTKSFVISDRERSSVSFIRKSLSIFSMRFRFLWRMVRKVSFSLSQLKQIAAGLPRKTQLSDDAGNSFCLRPLCIGLST